MTAQFEKLGNLVTIIGGGTPARSEPRYWNGDIPWASVKDFADIELSETDEHITQAGVDESATNIIRPGAVILPTRMALGKAAINSVQIAINQDLKALLPSKRLYNRYLLHFILSKAKELESKGVGATVKGIKLDVLQQLDVILPPLKEQERIATILDKADSIRRKRRHALTEVDAMQKAAFASVFLNSDKWPLVDLREIADLINGDRSSNYPSGNDILRSGVLFLSTKNIRESRLDLRKSQFISQEKFRSLGRGKLQRGDIVITLRGTVGQCAIFDCNYDTGFINAQLMILRPFKDARSSYIKSFLTSPRTQAELARIGSGSAVPQLTAKQIGDLRIPSPPLAIQEKFEATSNHLDRLHVKFERLVQESEALFHSISQRAFSGEL